MFGRLNGTSLTDDAAAEQALKDLLFTMVQFHPDDRFATAGQLVRAARDVNTRWRERAYRDLCKRPFQVVFAIDECAANLDLGAPAEIVRAELPYEQKKETIRRELQDDLTDARFQIGFPSSRDRYATDAHGAARWFLRGRRHLYRLERFRSQYHQGVECPWIAYLHQVVRGGVILEDMTTVPFSRVDVAPMGLRDTRKLVNDGIDPGTHGRWDDLVEYVRIANLDEDTEEVENHVVIAALREVLELQASVPDVNTYCVEVLNDELPDGIEGQRVVTFAYAEDRDGAMVEAHPYITAFTRTREERRPFEDWLRLLVRSRDFKGGLPASMWSG